jgi:hypothetical protein
VRFLLSFLPSARAALQLCRPSFSILRPFPARCRRRSTSKASFARTRGLQVSKYGVISAAALLLPMIESTTISQRNLRISAGWVFFIGGAAGIVTVIRAKTFSWKNYDFLTSEQDRKEELPMTPARRWILVAICVGLAIYGGARIHQDRDWNPFHKGGMSPPIYEH